MQDRSRLSGDLWLFCWLFSPIGWTYLDNSVSLFQFPYVIPMVYIVGASSLHVTVESTTYKFRKTIRNFITAIPGLSFCHNSRLKNLQHLLSQGKLKYQHNLLLWHDLINNTLSPHSSNNHKPWTPQQLVTALKQQSHRITAVIYCRRFGTADIFNQLLATDILIIRADKHLLSHRKRNNHWIKTQLAEVHPCVRIDLNLLHTVLQRSKKLQSIVIQNRSRTRKRESKKRSTSARRRNKKAKQESLTG